MIKRNYVDIWVFAIIICEEILVFAIDPLTLLLFGLWEIGYRRDIVLVYVFDNSVFMYFNLRRSDDPNVLVNVHDSFQFQVRNFLLSIILTYLSLFSRRWMSEFANFSNFWVSSVDFTLIIWWSTCWDCTIGG